MINTKEHCDINDKVPRLTECCGLVCSWYSRNKRTMPWRDRQDAYLIWVSEIMLQQTRIEAATPYFERFVTQLPTIRDLAECPQERLMKLWEGLGYYSRVRNMQKCAQILCAEYDGKFPADEMKLKDLPGIGPYTAGAIGSIAFSLPIPAVDGNVMRVVSRLLAYDEDVMSGKARKQVETLIREILPQMDPSDLNQGLMELGETICVPGTPDCEHCPVSMFCEARQKGMESSLPVRIVKTKKRVEEKTILVFTDGSRGLIHKRPDSGLLAGLFEFPALSKQLDTDEVEKYLVSRQIRNGKITQIGSARHVFSHIQWKMTGYEILVERMELERLGSEPECFLADYNELEQEYALPTAFAKYNDYLKRRLLS